MKHLKMLGLAVLAAMALMAVAGSASATVLCKEEKNPCGSADYPAGTEFKAEEMPENTMLWKSQGKTIDECSGSLTAGKTTNTGGLGSAVTVELSTFSWGTCSKSREIIKAGPLEIHYKHLGNSIGTVTLKELEWKEGLCTFGHSNIDIGDITKPETGKTYSTLLIDALYPRISGFGCGETVTFAATFKITIPTPLYVSES